MDDTVLVRIGQCVDHIVQDAHDVAWCEPRRRVERAAQGLALDVRHGEPQQPIVITGGQQWYDVRVLQLRG